MSDDLFDSLEARLIEAYLAFVGDTTLHPEMRIGFLEGLREDVERDLVRLEREAADEREAAELLTTAGGPSPSGDPRPRPASDSLSGRRSSCSRSRGVPGGPGSR